MSGVRTRKIRRSIEVTAIGTTGPIDYQLTFKRVKNLNLRIGEDGQVRVSAPYGVSVATVSEFVVRHEAFITAALRRASRQRRRFATGISYATGAVMYVLGYPATIVREPLPLKTPPYAVWDESDPLHLYLRVPDAATPALCQQVMKDFWSRLAMEIFTETVRRMYGNFIHAGYDIPYPALRVRLVKSRWGSCTPALKRIMLNIRLLEGPRSFIDYVVIHELAHLVYGDHSPRFWSVVSEFVPDYKGVRRAMTEFFRQIPSSMLGDGV